MTQQDTLWKIDILPVTRSWDCRGEIIFIFCSASWCDD